MIPLSDLVQSDSYCIREVYDTENAQERFEMELERALEVRFCCKPSELIQAE